MIAAPYQEVAEVLSSYKTLRTGVAILERIASPSGMRKRQFAPDSARASWFGLQPAGRFRDRFLRRRAGPAWPAPGPCASSGKDRASPLRADGAMPPGRGRGVGFACRVRRDRPHPVPPANGGRASADPRAWLGENAAVIGRGPDPRRAGPACLGPPAPVVGRSKRCARGPGAGIRSGTAPAGRISRISCRGRWR